MNASTLEFRDLGLEITTLDRYRICATAAELLRKRDGGGMVMFAVFRRDAFSVSVKTNRLLCEKQVCQII